MKPKARQKPRDIDKSPDRISQNISITHAQHLTHMSHISGYAFLSWFKDHIIRFPNIYRQLISLDHSDNLSNSQLTIFVKEEK
jgi:hypothetical protein